MQQHFAVGFLPVETFLLVADRLNRLPRRFLDLLLGDRVRTAHFTSQHNLVGGGQRFTRDAREGIGGKVEIDNGIGNPVAHLVGMALGNGFAREQEI